MFKKLSLSILLTVCINAALAETCPAIDEIKNNNWHGWEAYDSDDGAPLAPDDLKRFKKQVERFLLAEWADGAPEGESHCYYGDKTGQYMEAFLAKHGLHPAIASNHWHNTGFFIRCQAGIALCEFVPT